MKMTGLHKDNFRLFYILLWIRIVSFLHHILSIENSLLLLNQIYTYFTSKWLKWDRILWQSSAVRLADNNTEEADKYVEQELQISKMQATVMEMGNQLQMLMEQQQKQMEVTNKYFGSS